MQLDRHQVAEIICMEYLDSPNEILMASHTTYDLLALNINDQYFTFEVSDSYFFLWDSGNSIHKELIEDLHLELTCFYVKHSDGFIVWTSNDFVVGPYTKVIEGCLELFKYGDILAIFKVPHSDCLIIWTRNNLLWVWHHYLENIIHMSLHLSHQLGSIYIPHLYSPLFCLVLASR